MCFCVCWVSLWEFAYVDVYLRLPQHQTVLLMFNVCLLVSATVDMFTEHTSNFHFLRFLKALTDFDTTHFSWIDRNMVVHTFLDVSSDVPSFSMAEGPFYAALQGGPQWLVSLVTHAWWSVSALMNRVKAWKRKGKWGEGLPDGDSVTWQWIQVMTPFCFCLSNAFVYLMGLAAPDWVWLNEDYSKASVFHLSGFDIIRWWMVENLTGFTCHIQKRSESRRAVLQRTSDLVKPGRWKWRGPTNHHLSFDDVLKIYTCFGFLHVAAWVFQLLGTTDNDVNVNSLIIACPWALFANFSIKFKYRDLIVDLCPILQLTDNINFLK